MPHTIAPNPDGGSGESYCRLECWGRSTAQPTEPGTIGFTSGTQRSLLSPGLFFPSLASFGLPRSSVTPALGLPPHSYQTFVTPLPSQSAFPAGQHKKKLLETSFRRAAINPRQISYVMLTHLWLQASAAHYRTQSKSKSINVFSANKEPWNWKALMEGSVWLTPRRNNAQN